MKIFNPKVVVCEPLVPEGFKAITIFPFIFIIDEDCKNDKVLMNHESIHIKQQIELLWVGFFVLYFLEYIYGRIMSKDNYESYRSISLEKEAKLNESNFKYLNDRKLYSSFRYFISNGNNEQNA